jgi:hypothetical protein
MNWVAPALTDGLGNRLFQLACCLGYSEKHNKECVFFLPRCKSTGHGKFENIFLLFPNIRIIETENSWKELNEREKEWYIYEDLEMKSGALVIRGLRQSYKYFKDCIIKPNFENSISKDRLTYINKTYLQNKENLFFIHIRLGDFCFLPHHQINLEKYYSAALKEIPENTEILVFSDQHIYTKNLFQDYKVCDLEDEIETLYTMSMCLKGAIVSNSTFSYWGSYFAHQNHKDHKAIFPSSLGDGLPNPTDYYPDYAIIVKL